MAGIPLAEAFVRVRPDTSGFRRETEQGINRGGFDKAGEQAGAQFGGGFTRQLAGAYRDAAGRLRDERGRFVSAGSEAGRSFGDGFFRDATGRLRDARGRFVSEGRGSGEAFGRGFSLGGLSGMGGMQALISAGIAIGPAIVPAAAAATAAIAAIGPAAIAGAAGLGVVVLASLGVVEAVKQMSAVQEQARQSGATMAAQQAAVAAAADQVRSAERALTNTRAAMAEGARRAARQVTDAQRDLTGAEKDAIAVRQDLSRAQEEARRAMEDLASQVRGNALDQRQADLDIAEAKAELNKVLADPKASQQQRQQAQLTYERQIAYLDDLRRRGRDLAVEQQAANRAGIEGSAQVQAARQRIADADERVAAAQRALDDARRAQSEQARQAAFQLAQATDAVTAAQRSLGTASTQAGVGGTAAMLKLKQAMADLSPEGRRFSTFIFGLKDEFLSLRQSAEAGVLPGLQTGIQALLPYLPQINKFVKQIGGAVGGFFAQIGKALASPFWADFFDQIGQMAGPMFKDFATILVEVARGFATLMIAFAPLSKDLVKGLVKLATAFADWAAEFVASQQFKDFLDYLKANGPTLGKLFLDLATVALNLLVALAPLGEVVLKGLGALVGWLAKLDPGVLLYMVGAITLIGAAVVALVAGPAAAIAGFVAAIMAIVGAVIYAYNNVAWFRTAVQTVFAAVAATAMWLWNSVLKPAFNGIAAGAMWLWTNGIKPAMDGIGAAFSWVWQNVILPVVSALKFWFENILMPVVMMLWRNAVLPAFQGIKLAISVAWAAIKVVFGLIQIWVKIVAAVFTWLWANVIKPVWSWIYDKAIKPAWDKIRGVFQALGGFITTHVVPAFKAGVGAIGKAWEKIRDVAKIPIRFVIETVLNKGILGAYNKIAKLFHVKPDNVQIPLPKGFAGGGRVRGPGTGTSDSIPALLSNGEYVIPARVVRGLGVGFFDRLIGRPGTSRPGDGSEGLAFAKGGLVGFIKDAWDAVSHPAELIRKPVEALFSRIPGAGLMRDMVAGVGQRLVSGLLSWVKGGGGTGATGNVGKTQAFIRAQAGKPYVWASAGPGGYDCSGLVSAAYNVYRGRNPYSHTFSTHTMASFLKPGRGVFTAGYAHAGERGGGSVGHTAASLAGLAFESRGGDGVVVGPRATPVTAFARLGHFAAGGLVGRLPFGSYDLGGYLPTGLSLAYNGTGAPERVGGGDIHIHLHNQGVIGSRRELDDWLATSLVRLRADRRIPAT